MEWITDSDLKHLLGSPEPPITNVDLSCAIDHVQSQIQPCSVDLRIDEIFLPVEKFTDPGAVPRKELHDLEVGQSVKVSLIEKFDFGNDLAGIIFAPARISRCGIVVPDIGHIDPGFKGDLRLTLMNMGREPYRLVKKQTVATILIFKLHKKCLYGLDQRQGPQPHDGGLIDIRHLAPDFLNISRKAKTVAQAEARRVLGKSGWVHALWTLALVVLPVVGGIGGAYIVEHLSLDRDVAKVTSKVESLEKAIDVQMHQSEAQFEATVDQKNLHVRIEGLQKQIDELRATAKAPPKASSKP
jgi:dCTP deaminase